MLRNKGKTIRKDKKKSKSSFASPKIKRPYRDVYLVYKGELDKTSKARFTNQEIKTMRTRAKKYRFEISENEYGIPIAESEWDKFDARLNWDVFELETSKGKKIRLLATLKESNVGYVRADPSWMKRKKKPIEIEGQTTLDFG